MGNPYHYYDWRPSPEQRALLRAALLPDRQGCESWLQSYRSDGNSTLDHGCYCLLPLVYHNSRLQNIGHPKLEAFKKVYRETWAKNHLLFSKIVPLIKSFQQAGIKTLILKGAALVSFYYQDYGLRPMGDFDLLVPSHQAMPAYYLLKGLGWTPLLRHPDRFGHAYLSANYALHFTGPKQVDLDLHWHLLNECYGAEADRDIWANAIPIEFHGIPTLTLNPADHLLHICIHGSRWNKMPPIRWVADAVTLINNPSGLDWDYLATQTQKRRLILPMKGTLQYLKENLNASIPFEFLEMLKGLSVSEMEKREFKARNKPPGWASYLPFMWAMYPRIARDTGRPAGLLGFMGYLQSFWELRYPWQAPLYAVWMGLERILKKSNRCGPIRSRSAGMNWW